MLNQNSKYLLTVVLNRVLSVGILHSQKAPGLNSPSLSYTEPILTIGLQAESGSGVERANGLTDIKGSNNARKLSLSFP